MKVALCIIATGKYTRFLCELLGTARKFFCAGHEVRVFCFSDTALVPRICGLDLVPVAIAHEPWPGPTLHRYGTMLQAAEDLLGCDYVYYLDVDSRFVRGVGEEIFGDLVGTIHFGYCECPRQGFEYEGRCASRARVGPTEGQRYYCGGFQGGRAAVYVEAMRAMAVAIADDEGRGIVARWHDESHWNRYLIDHPPTLVLSHDYLCPPPWRPETQRIVIVDKDNGEVRG